MTRGRPCNTAVTNSRNHVGDSCVVVPVLCKRRSSRTPGIAEVGGIGDRTECRTLGIKLTEVSFHADTSAEASTRALITLPRVSKDLLMAAPSFNRVPADPAVLAFSEPAKSTKFTCSFVC